LRMLERVCHFQLLDFTTFEIVVEVCSGHRKKVTPHWDTPQSKPLA
jgi:hypothetical protein